MPKLRMCGAILLCLLLWRSGMTTFLGAFAKMRKPAISFGLSLRIGELGFQWTDFYEILYSSVFRKPANEIGCFIKI
jgi:hypothetical protein